MTRKYTVGNNNICAAEQRLSADMKNVKLSQVSECPFWHKKWDPSTYTTFLGTDILIVKRHMYFEMMYKKINVDLNQSVKKGKRTGNEFNIYNNNF